LNTITFTLFKSTSHHSTRSGLWLTSKSISWSKPK
jgi:hypothetical protein